MKVRTNITNQRGSILILAVWTLMFLSVFAAQIGIKVRQRATLISRLENKSHLQFIADAGVKKAISALRQDLERNKGLYSAHGKFYRHNNPDLFKQFAIGDGVCDVAYSIPENQDGQLQYGFVDEESKININVADLTVLTRLFTNVLPVSDEEALGMADAIIGWREMGDTQIAGFYSQDYYTNLEYPYESKNGELETIDELILLRGIRPEMIEALKPYITVYGDGSVNINTAPYQVLIALGLMDSVVDKILLVRRGFDGIDATIDDYVFQKTFDIASEIRSFVALDREEIKQIDLLNSLGILKTNSFYFSIQSHAGFDYRKDRLMVSSVYNSIENKIVYWRQN